MIKFLAVCLLAFAALLIPSNAKAAATCAQGVCDTQAQAAAQCAEVAAYWSSQGQLVQGCTVQVFGPGNSNPAWTATPLACGDGTMCEGLYHMIRSGSVDHYYVWRVGGTSGTQTTPEECQAVAADPSFNFGENSSFMTATPCFGGCAVSKLPGTPGFSVTVGGATQYWGNYQFSGEVCAKTPETPPKEAMKTLPPAQCVAAGAGQTYCTRNDGKQCYSASTGRQICWSPGETGVKRDMNIAQNRCLSASSCTAPVISGETVTATGTPITATTTSGSTTTTTTNNNYTTTNAAPQNDGQTADTATGGTKSATGGNCDASYICSGDGIACASLEEQRKTRCAIEHKGEGISGGEDCITPPVCAGTKCDAAAYAITVQSWKGQCAANLLSTKADLSNAKLDAINASIQGISGGTGSGSGLTLAELAGDGSVPGTDDGTPGVGAGSAEGSGHNSGTVVGGDGLDGSGRGLARSCPTPPAFEFMGTMMTLDTSWLCLGGEVESVILLLIVGVFCLRYIGAA